MLGCQPEAEPVRTGFAASNSSLNGTQPETPEAEEDWSRRGVGGVGAKDRKLIVRSD